MKHETLAHEQWIEARKALLASEKAFTRQRDELSRARRALPWERIEKPYAFDGQDGRESLADLFAGRSQLIVYHFMYGPDWDEGCKSCSLLADHFEPAVVHLAHRDVTLVACSIAPLAKLEAYRRRMGWTFKWVSSAPSDFNRDLHVSFTEDELEGGRAYYNYSDGGFPSSEAPGASVFYKNEAGEVFHTYDEYEDGAT